MGSSEMDSYKKQQWGACTRNPMIYGRSSVLDPAMSGRKQRALGVNMKGERKWDSSGQCQVWNLGTFGSGAKIKKNLQTT